MQNDLFDEMARYFPAIAEDTAECDEKSCFELVVTLRDGSRFLYDDVDKSVRKLPKSERLMSEEECRSEFGHRLRKMMIRKGLTQAELSNKSGVPQPMISGYMTGRTNPGFFNVDKLAKALDCSTDDFRYL